MSAARRVLDPFRPTYVGGATTGEHEANVEPPHRAAPQTPREAMLARRHERLAKHSVQDSRRQTMLERRAKRLHGG
jgi:hypothetical protein